MPRGKKVVVVCEICGNEFIALAVRVRDGLSRFCSRDCFREYQHKPKVSVLTGKENARVHWCDGMKMVHWVDENGNRKNSSYVRWFYEMTTGTELGSDRVCYVIDGADKDNPRLDDIVVCSRSEMVSAKLTGKPGTPHTEEAKEKMSKWHKGKKLSPEHAAKLRANMIRLWNAGRFDTVHRGQYNHHWRDGSSQDIYPPEFNDGLRAFIADRDNHICQICAKSASGQSAHVHHINGNKSDNSYDNLILFCSSCHSKIHKSKFENLSPVMQAFKSQLSF